MDDEDWGSRFCHHGFVAHECEQCDEEVEAMGGIDKCLNCGRYKTGNQLNRFQCCAKGCRNPNEY